MEDNKLDKLNELLEYVTPTKENQEKIKEIKDLIHQGNLKETMKKIDELFAENNINPENASEEDADQAVTNTSTTTVGGRRLC